MAHGVVPDQVTGFLDGTCQVGTTAGKIADHEEDGADLVLRQKVEQLPGVGIIGPVIEGECDLVPIKASSQGPAEELRRRPPRCIGISPHSEAGNQACGKQFETHASRV